MRLRATVLLPVLFVTYISASARSDEASPFVLLTGLWVDASKKLGCAKDLNPYGIGFSDDRSRMLLGIGAPLHGPPGEIHPIGEMSEYQVVQSSPYVRVKHELDTQTTDLILISRDRLCWHLTDAPAGTCFQTFDRCPYEWK